MDSKQLKALVIKLRLSLGKFVIFGSGCLAIRDLQTTTDMDLYMTRKLYDRLKTEYGGEVTRFGQTNLVFNTHNVQVVTHESGNIGDLSLIEAFWALTAAGTVP